MLAVFHGVLASGTLLPVLLAVGLTLLIDGVILRTVWCCGQGRPPRPSGRPSRLARAAREVVVSHRFADAVERGDFAEAEAEATRFFSPR